MNVPYTVCHILSALDGRISGAFMGLDSVHDAAASYARIRFDYQADAWVYGSATTREFVSAAAPYPRSLSSDVPSDFAAEKDAGLYYVSVDPKGEIGWSSPTFIRPGCPEAHVIEVLLEDAPDAYREYLRERGISYLTCGRQTLNCRLLKEKLYAHFGVRTMLVCGGGRRPFLPFSVPALRIFPQRKPIRLSAERNKQGGTGSHPPDLSGQ